MAQIKGGQGKFLLKPGDVMVVEVKPIGNNKENATTIYFSEQI